LNLDDLIQSIPDSESALRRDLARWVQDWKLSAESLEKFAYLMDKWHGNVRFQEDNDSDAFYQNWRSFNALAIDGIGGMTMNERLYLFGLLELWDESDEKLRAVLRMKMKANA
jgi:hypothetical protein